MARFDIQPSIRSEARSAVPRREQPGPGMGQKGVIFWNAASR